MKVRFIKSCVGVLAARKGEVRDLNQEVAAHYAQHGIVEIIAEKPSAKRRTATNKAKTTRSKK